MPQEKSPTPAEMEILKILWEQGSSSVRDVFEQIARDKNVHFNTVQTLLRLMETKGLVRHHSAGRTFIYTARYSRDDSAAGFLERVFDGAAPQLVQSLLRSERISSEELEQLQEMIAKARRQRRTGAKGGE